MKSNGRPTLDPGRIAYSIAKLSPMLGKDRTWGYRMAQKRRIPTITGFGSSLVSAEGIERILSGNPVIDTGRNTPSPEKQTLKKHKKHQNS